jgi:hypothetical protein
MAAAGLAEAGLVMQHRVLQTLVVVAALVMPLVQLLAVLAVPVSSLFAILAQPKKEQVGLSLQRVGIPITRLHLLGRIQHELLCPN